MHTERTPWVPERLAGRGGLGEVWAARDPATGLRVAMKVLPGLSGDRAPAFLDEVRAVAALHHPNVVRVFDFGMVDAAQAAASGGAFPVGAPWLVMEWVGGGPLPVPRRWEELRDALRVLLGALAHAHARGVLHRDLKPANVLLPAPGDLRPGPKLVDFGLARLPGSMRVGNGSGTPAYMAPEQVAGGAEGPGTDLYAVGAMTWKLVTGSVPFGGNTVEELVHARLAGVLPLFRPTVDVPAELGAWLARLLARWPEQRFPFAADALRALDALGPPVPIVAPPSRPTTAFEATVSFDASRVVPLADLPRPPVEEPPQPTPLSEEEIPPAWTPEPVELASWVGLTALRLFGLRELPLEGRVAERDQLWAELREAAAAGRPRVVVLRGPAGVGKSRLARWLVEEVHALGVALPMRAAQGRPPAADDVLRALVTEAVRLPADAQARAAALERHPAGEDIERALSAEERLPTRIAATLRVLRAAAGARPLVLWLDDVQWSGTALALALSLLRGAEAGPTLAVLTAQDEALADRPVERAALDALLTRRAASALAIGPLSDAELTALLDRLLPLEPVTARFVRRHAAGNVLLALRLVDTWVARGVLVETPRGLGVPALPDLDHLDLADVIADELEALLVDRPPAEGASIERAAVLGDTVYLDEWAAAAGSLGVPTVVVLRLLDRGILRRGAGCLVFAQGLFRLALRRRAARAGREAGHHVAAAEALVGRPGTEGRVGEHWLAAGRPERAVDPLLAAVVARSEEGAISAVGVYLRAARTALDAAAVPRSDPRWGLYLEWDMWLHCTSVSPSAGVGASRALADWADANGDAPRAIMGRVREVLNRAYCGEPIDALAELRALWARAQEVDHPSCLMTSGDFLAAELRNRGQLEEAARVARAILARGDALGHTRMRAIGTRHLAMFARMLGNLDEALAMCRLGEPYQIPNTWGHSEIIAVRGDVLRERGQWEAAAEAYLQCARILHTIGSFDANVPLLNLALVRLDEGRMDEADAILQRCVVSLVQSEQRRMEAIARVLRLAPLARRGDRAGFAAELAAGRPVLEGTGYVDPDVAGALVHAAREARAQGWEAEARDVAGWAHAQWRAFGRAEAADAVAAAYLGEAAG